MEEEIFEPQVFEWKDEYALGVDELDRAHRQLFSVVNRVINNFMDMDFEKNRKTCIEAVKFLKDHTMKHFAEEEAYQVANHYGGYAIHKRIHDNMREVILPNLEKELTTKSYSKEALQHFIGVCTGWLAGHILVEDQAIVGKRKSKWTEKVVAHDNKDEFLDGVVRKNINEIFHFNAELANGKYTGYKLTKPFCYGDTYTTEDGRIVAIMTAVEETALKKMAADLFNEKLFQMNAVMSSMLGEMLTLFNTNVVMGFLGERATSIKSKIISNTEFYYQYEHIYPEYTMIWRTGHGYIACCLTEISQEQFATFKDK